MKSSLVVLDFASWTCDDAGNAADSAQAKMIPPMLRRRLSAIGKAAASTAFSIDGAVESEIPMVFASRWGDLSLACGQITEVAAGRAASPAKFAVSVHNAVQAMISIYAGHTGAQTAIAAGKCTAEAGFEAADLYLEEFEKVLLVVYDEDAHQVGGSSSAHAAALLLSKTGPGLMTLELSSRPADPEKITASDDAESSLEWILWLRSKLPELHRNDCAHDFTWKKSFTK